MIKSNDGIDPATVDGIHEQLRRISGGAEFALLEVRSTDETPAVGTVDWVRPGLLRGFVSRFAPYERADDVDMPAWTSILAGALELFPCPQWADRLASWTFPVPVPRSTSNFPRRDPTGRRSRSRNTPGRDGRAAERRQVVPDRWGRLPPPRPRSGPHLRGAALGGPPDLRLAPSERLDQVPGRGLPAG